MQTFETRVQSILQGISRLNSVRGPVEPGTWIDESLEEIDTAVWQVVETLIDEGRIER
jgi:hypothetical protein